MQDPVKYRADLDAYLLRREPKMIDAIKECLPSFFKHLQEMAEISSKLKKYDEYRTHFFKDEEHSINWNLKPRPKDERIPYWTEEADEDFMICSMIYRFGRNLYEGYDEFVKP